MYQNNLWFWNKPLPNTSAVLEIKIKSPYKVQNFEKSGHALFARGCECSDTDSVVDTKMEQRFKVVLKTEGSEKS